MNLFLKIASFLFLSIYSFTACSDRKYIKSKEFSKQIYMNWGIEIQGLCIYKSVVEKHDNTVTYYLFVDEYDNYKSYQLNEEDDVFKAKANTVNNEIPMKGKEVKYKLSEYFKDSKYSFDIDEPYLFFFASKESMDIKEYNSNYYSYDINTYDRFYDKLMVYYLLDSHCFCLIDINGGER